MAIARRIASIIDESSFTEGSSSFSPIGGVVNDAIVSDPSEDQSAAARITPKRALHVNLRNQAGIEVGTTTDPVRTDPVGTTTQPISASALPLPTGAATEITLASIDTNFDVALSTRLADTTFTGRINTLGQKTMANSTPVVIASDQTSLSTTEIKSGTTAITSVVGSTSNTIVLAANTSRLGATIFNGANKNMYLKLGATASTSSYTVVLSKDSYYEVPFSYTGTVDAVWATGVSGSALVTEFTV